MRQFSPDSPFSTAGSSSGMLVRAYASTKQRPADNAASRTPSACSRQREQEQVGYNPGLHIIYKSRMSSLSEHVECIAIEIPTKAVGAVNTPTSSAPFTALFLSPRVNPLPPHVYLVAESVQDQWQHITQVALELRLHCQRQVPGSSSSSSCIDGQPAASTVTHL